VPLVSVATASFNHAGRWSPASALMLIDQRVTGRIQAI
jgi:hypothetical protein